MRILTLTVVLALAAMSTGCSSSKGAAAPMGTVAGDMVGGVAWVGVKGAGLAWKGGKVVAKDAGKTVVGAAKGIHEEFAKPDNPPPATTTKTAAISSAPISQPAVSQQ